MEFRLDYQKKIVDFLNCPKVQNILLVQRKQWHGIQQRNAWQQHTFWVAPHRISILLIKSSPYTKKQKCGIKCPIIGAKSSTRTNEAWRSVRHLILINVC